AGPAQAHGEGRIAGQMDQVGVVGHGPGRAVSAGTPNPKGFDKAIQLWQRASIQAWEGPSMPKEEWGVKRLCPTTGKRFYDLNKTPVISPYTGEVVPIDLPGRKGSISMVTESAKAKAGATADIDADDVLLDDDDD